VVTLAVVLSGVLAAALGWRLVATGRLDVWTAMGVVMGTLGLAALLTGVPALSPREDPWVAAAAGVGSGLALFVATRVFVRLVAPWMTFQRHAASIYGQRAGRSLAAALLVAAGVVVAGEELFWRGLVQPRLAGVGAVGRTGGAAAAWLLYVGVNAASGSLVLVAGGIVGGAVWAALAWWTGGVLAPLLCHAVWTTSMIVLPPPSRPA
jgi:membrane protease YdiL (CAAX protease family)